MARDDSESLLNRIFGEWEGSRTFLAMCILLAFIAVGGYLLWTNYGPYVLTQKKYELTTESIEITPQPAWITQSNVAAESANAGGLSGLSVRQPDLTVVVSQAFRMHAWVKSVNHVTKRHPARVLVDLTYRQPVAMVEIPYSESPTGIGRLPVDIEGVLLPTADFTAQLAKNYLRISAGDTTPASNIAGTAWGDERVHGAAQVAAFLTPHHLNFGLTKITAYRGPQRIQGKNDLYYVLRSREGTTIIWGRAPGDEQAGEPPAEQKLTRLAEYIQQHGSLMVDHPGQTIDLRRADGLQIATLPDELQ
ncbi:MAG: hypothetical protein AAF497_13770 [Planctomycetota bacterium]